SAAAGERPPEAVAVPFRRVRESEARIDVARRVVEVVDPVLVLFRCSGALVAAAEVQRQVVERAPVVLDVCVLFLNAVLQVVRSVGNRVRADAAGPERREAGAVVHAAAAAPEAPEAAVEIVGAVIEL